MLLIDAYGRLRHSLDSSTFKTSYIYQKIAAELDMTARRRSTTTMEVTNEVSVLTNKRIITVCRSIVTVFQLLIMVADWNEVAHPIREKSLFWHQV
jgi:hypothetical protein